MGIVLEFGEDDSDASPRHSSSPAPSEAPSTRPQPIIHRSPLRPIGRPGATAPEPYFGRPKEQPNNHDFYRQFEQPGKHSSDHEDDDDDEDMDDYEDMEEPEADSETEQAMQIARRAALGSALNKWRNAAAKAQRNQGAVNLAASMSRLSLGGQRQAQTSAQVPQRPQTRFQGPSQAPSQLQKTTEARSQSSALMPSSQPRIPARPLDESAPSSGPNQTRPALPQQQGTARSSSLLSIFDRWRDAAMQRKEEEPRSLSPVEERTNETTTRVPNLGGKEEQKPPSLSPQQSRTLRAARTTSLREALANRVNAKQTNQREAAQNASPSSAATPPHRPFDGALRPAPTSQDRGALREQEERDHQRATRARQIFLASRVFNHWADKTARRLEREAVARRHMIRFRCFRGWSQLPTSRTPTVDHLRVVTAAQKLKRACLENEEQLRVTAAAALQSYRLKKIHACLDRWYYHLAENVAQHRLAHRTRLKTVSRWFLRAEDDADLGQAVTTHRTQANGRTALIRWQGAAERGTMRDDAAGQLGGRHLAWKYLRDWWDQAEAARRSREFRQQSLAQLASHAFDIWNLQARAQAFVWHTQYRTVSRIFDYWLERSQEDAQMQREARLMHEATVKARWVDRMRQHQQQQAVLERQANRATLYIRSHRLLAVFDDATNRREERDWQQVRQYLMHRYEEVSRARKKRNFFRALDRWRASAAQGQQVATEAQRLRRGQEERRVLATLDKWSAQSAEAEDIGQRAQSDALRGRFFQTLNTWTEAAADHDYNQQAAQQHDADRKKRQVQKIWSNATLQHGSHAHTAAALKQRYDRDKRNKSFNVLLRWHTRDTANTHADTELASRTKRLSLGSSIQPRNQAQENASRRLLFGASQGTPSRPPTSRHTPTPRRGRVDFAMSSMASAKRPTPIREEAGEGSRALSDEEGDNQVKSPVKSPRGFGSLMTFPKLPSTTPRGPIPPRVESGFIPKSSLLAARGPPRPPGNPYQSGRRDPATITPSTNPTFGTGTGFSSRSTSGLLDRSTSDGSATSRSAGPYSRTTGTGGQPAVLATYQPSKLSQKPLFGSSMEIGGTYRSQLPDRLFPSPERKQEEEEEEEEDLWDHLEGLDWEKEELE